jgi:flagellar FliL protein
MAAKKEAAKPAGGDAPAKSGKGKLIAIILGVVVALGGGGGAAWFMFGKDAKAESAEEGGKSGKKGKKSKDDDGEEDGGGAKQPAKYLAMDPAFVVNLAGPDADRYLQVQVELMTRDPLAADAIKLHTPAIRDRLLLLFGTKTAEELASRDGRESLRQLALAEVQKVMNEETGEDAVEALYFTSFVTQ